MRGLKKIISSEILLRDSKKYNKEQTEKGEVRKLTSKALCPSFSIHTISWSLVVLQEITMCSNLPSTGTAVLTTGGNRPHLQI